MLPLVNQGEACCCHATALRYQSATMAAAATLFPVRSTNKSSNRWKDGCFNHFVGGERTTGLSKRNGAKLRESFCPAAASHARLVLSKTVLFSAQVCIQRRRNDGRRNRPERGRKTGGKTEGGTEGGTEGRNDGGREGRTEESMKIALKAGIRSHAMGKRKEERKAASAAYLLTN